MPPDVPVRDSSRLRSLRTARGMSLSALAAKVGLSKGELSKLETGVRPLRPDHVAKLAKAFEIAPADLIGEASALRVMVAPEPAATLPLYDGRDLARVGNAAEPIGRVDAPAQLRSVPDAYAITINDLSNAPALMPGVVLHVHPGRAPALGDLVVNRVSWSPLAFYLRQDDDGRFYGLTLSRRRVELSLEEVERLHKVAGIWFVG